MKKTKKSKRKKRRRRYIDPVQKRSASNDDDDADNECCSHAALWICGVCVMAVVLTCIAMSLARHTFSSSMYGSYRKRLRKKSARRIGLKKTDNFMNVVLKGFPSHQDASDTSNMSAAGNEEEQTNDRESELQRLTRYVKSAVAGSSAVDVRCLRRRQLFQTSQEVESLYAPTFHSNNVIAAYKRNHRPLYKEVGESVSLYSEGATVDARHTSALIGDMQREPYENVIEEPIPAVCIFYDASVTKDGNVCNSNNICLQSKACGGAYGHYMERSPRHDVVYSISEWFGEGFFHFMAENFLRIFVGLDFLTMEGIGITAKIHIITPKQFVINALKAVGIDERRILKSYRGVNAKALVFPEPIGCGSPTRALLLLGKSEILSRNVPTKLLHRPLGIDRTTQRQTITVIRRRYSRAVANHDRMVTTIYL